jgi:mannose-6-phosphate isomerase-like protein (cupin superfamily)
MEAQIFELKTPFLREGNTHNVIAATDLMSIALKYYNEGGENALHTHPGEDHAFLILDGEMTLYDKEEQAIVLKRGQGIMIPSGWSYWFKNSGDGPLIFLKFSAFKKEAKGAKGDGHGKLLAPGFIEEKREKAIPVDGSFWTL